MHTARIPALLRLLQNVELPRKLGICERLFARRLSAAGVQWIHTAAGIPWKLDLRNATHRWIVYGKYEGAPFLDWAKRYLSRDGVFVDSGANIGQMLLYVAQWVPDGRVLAIEPGAHQANWLAECLEANPELPVELIRLGLGAERSELFLEDPASQDRHGSWNRVSQTTGERIEIVRLTDLLQQRRVERVDLWKLDVEGYEIPALKGARDYLTDHRIRALYVELRGDNGRAIRAFLEPLGYHCHLFATNGRLYSPSKLPDDSNGLFLPRAL